MRHLAQCLLVGLLAQSSPAPSADEFAKAITDLASRDRKVQEAAIDTLGRLRDPRALHPLTALRQGVLYLTAEGALVIAPTEKEKKVFLKDGTELAPLTDALTRRT